MNYKIKKIGHHGFSLIEIMVALVLVSTMFLLIPSKAFNTEHEKLNETIDDFDRAIRFAQNEAVLRNSIVRLHIELDEEPIQYAVEYGPGENLALPEYIETDKLSLREQEAHNKILKNLDSQFNRVQEFSEGAKPLPDNVIITGIVSSYIQEIKKTGSVAIYFYPTGEKDASLIFFSTPEEMATLDIKAFESNAEADFFRYSESELANLEYSQENRMKELYQTWLKK